MMRFVIPAALAACAFAASSPAHAAEVQIAVHGPVVELSLFETVELEPDMVSISAGVTNQAATAVEALRANSAEMQRVIDRLKSRGIAANDIQTSGINLSPRYDYDRSEQKQVFRGYQVSNRVSVKLRKIEETGELLDALVMAGATDIGGPSFSVEDSTAAQDTVRQRAMERARQRAQDYAEMAGYGGVRLLEVSEAPMGGRPVAMADTRVMLAEASPAPPPVEPGMISTGIYLSVKFEMTSKGE